MRQVLCYVGIILGQFVLMQDFPTTYWPYFLGFGIANCFLFKILKPSYYFSGFFQRGLH